MSQDKRFWITTKNYSNSFLIWIIKKNATSIFSFRAPKVGGWHNLASPTAEFAESVARASTYSWRCKATPIPHNIVLFFQHLRATSTWRRFSEAEFNNRSKDQFLKPINMQNIYGPPLNPTISGKLTFHKDVPIRFLNTTTNYTCLTIYNPFPI